MPSQPGRVRMPNKNRVDTSRSLSTNDVWKNVVKYDPYKEGPSGEEAEASKKEDFSEQSKGLLELARLSKSSESKAMCKKCGGLGHLTFECRNTVKLPPPPPRRVLPQSYLSSSILKRKAGLTSSSSASLSSSSLMPSTTGVSSSSSSSMPAPKQMLERERSRSRSRERR